MGPLKLGSIIKFVQKNSVALQENENIFKSYWYGYPRLGNGSSKQFTELKNFTNMTNMSKNVFYEHALVLLVEYFLASVMLSQKNFTLLVQWVQFDEHNSFCEKF